MLFHPNKRLHLEKAGRAPNKGYVLCARAELARYMLEQEGLGDIANTPLNLAFAAPPYDDIEFSSVYDYYRWP